jgi:hypothetical protein
VELHHFSLLLLEILELEVHQEEELVEELVELQLEEQQIHQELQQHPDLELEMVAMLEDFLV